MDNSSPKFLIDEKPKLLISYSSSTHNQDPNMRYYNKTQKIYLNK